MLTPMKNSKQRFLTTLEGFSPFQTSKWHHSLKLFAKIWSSATSPNRLLSPAQLLCLKEIMPIHLGAKRSHLLKGGFAYVPNRSTSSIEAPASFLTLHKLALFPGRFILKARILRERCCVIRPSSEVTDTHLIISPEE